MIVVQEHGQFYEVVLGTSSAGCASANFSICGQAKAYQKGHTDAFHTTVSIDNVYVEGISITLGSPRKHVWTYAAGLSDDGNHNSGLDNCPCAVNPGLGPPWSLCRE